MCVCERDKLDQKDVSSEEFRYGFASMSENFPKVTDPKDNLHLNADIVVCLL